MLSAVSMIAIPEQANPKTKKHPIKNIGTLRLYDSRMKTANATEVSRQPAIKTSRASLDTNKSRLPI
jgi:hypothetical protein